MDAGDTMTSYTVTSTWGLAGIEWKTSVSSGRSGPAAILAGVAVVCLLALVVPASAGGTIYPTADDAAGAGFRDILAGWDFIGSCDAAVSGSDLDTVCYRPSTRFADDSFTIFSAAPNHITDIGWWLGVERVGDAWRAYGHGNCGLFYCRVFEPSGRVISGWPDGDVDFSGTTNSVDAVLVLQNVAGLPLELACDPCGNVDLLEGLTAADAQLILESEAGLIPGLPTPGQWDGPIP